MAIGNSVMKKIIGVKESVIETAKIGTVDVPDYFIDESGNVKRSVKHVESIFITVRPRQSKMNLCPVCHRKCTVFDRKGSSKVWRSRDVGDLRCYIIGPNHRIDCPKHGHQTVSVEWADPSARFTRNFDTEAAFLYKSMSKTSVSQYLGIDWESVGSCISRARKRLEPNPESRLNNLVNIGVDETSYRKGHSYITVVVNHDNGEVVWVAKGHGEKVFSSFFEKLNEKQRASIKTITGDGARWIDSCIAK